MPIYYKNQLFEDSSYLGSNLLSNYYQGNTLVSGYSLGVVQQGLAAYYDIQNPFSYQGGTSVYSLSAPTQVANPSLPAGFDYGGTPATASSVVNIGGNIGNALYFPQVNDWNNIQFISGTQAINGYESGANPWSFLITAKVTEVPTGIYPYTNVMFASNFEGGGEKHMVQFDSAGSASIYVSDDLIATGIPLGLNTWNIIQVGVRKPGVNQNIEVNYNINNVYTGSNITGSNKDIKLLNGFVSNYVVQAPFDPANKGAGKGYVQVAGLWEAKLTQAQMTTNYNALASRYF
jgi:hypothetical protein